MRVLVQPWSFRLRSGQVGRPDLARDKGGEPTAVCSRLASSSTCEAATLTKAVVCQVEVPICAVVPFRCPAGCPARLLPPLRRAFLPAPGAPLGAPPSCEILLGVRAAGDAGAARVACGGIAMSFPLAGGPFLLGPSVHTIVLPIEAAGAAGAACRGTMNPPPPRGSTLATATLLHGTPASAPAAVRCTRPRAFRHGAT